MTDAKVIKMSRRAAKSIHSDTRARINQATNGHERLKQRAAEMAGQLRSARAMLEAIVHRHGPQLFEREEIERLLGSTRLFFDVTDKRLTIKLSDEVPDMLDT
jgi:hypothetical protein